MNQDLVNDSLRSSLRKSSISTKGHQIYTLFNVRERGRHDYLVSSVNLVIEVVFMKKYI